MYMTHMHRIASATVTLREAGHTSKNGNYLAHDRSCQTTTKGLGRIMKPGTPGYGVGIFWQNFASQSVIMLTKNWQIFLLTSKKWQMNIARHFVYLMCTTVHSVCTLLSYRYHQRQFSNEALSMESTVDYQAEDLYVWSKVDLTQVCTLCATWRDTANRFG